MELLMISSFVLAAAALIGFTVWACRFAGADSRVAAKVIINEELREILRKRQSGQITQKKAESRFDELICQWDAIQGKRPKSKTQD